MPAPAPAAVFQRLLPVPMTKQAPTLVVPYEILREKVAAIVTVTAAATLIRIPHLPSPNSASTKAAVG
jgi:hypothetical protein